MTQEEAKQVLLSMIETHKSKIQHASTGPTARERLVREVAAMAIGVEKIKMIQDLIPETGW